MAPSLALAVVCAALAALAALQSFLLGRTLRRLAQRQQRVAVQLAEAQRYSIGRKQLRAAQETTEVAVELGTNTVRTVHQAIASIPFTILENIPVTSEPAKLVRKIHDSTAGGVYDTITAVNQIIGKGLRTQLGTAKPEPGSKKKEEPKT